MEKTETREDNLLLSQWWQLKVPSNPEGTQSPLGVKLSKKHSAFGIFIREFGEVLALGLGWVFNIETWTRPQILTLDSSKVASWPFGLHLDGSTCSSRCRNQASATVTPQAYVLAKASLECGEKSLGSLSLKATACFLLSPKLPSFPSWLSSSAPSPPWQEGSPTCSMFLSMWGHYGRICFIPTPEILL